MDVKNEQCRICFQRAIHGMQRVLMPCHVVQMVGGVQILMGKPWLVMGTLRGRRVEVVKVAVEKLRRKPGAGLPPAVRIRTRLAGPCSPSSGHGFRPWRGVRTYIRKVVEGMHWRMHDEPSFTIGSHRGKVPYRNHRKNKTTRITYCIWLYFFLFLVKFAKLNCVFQFSLHRHSIQFNRI